MAAHWGKIQSLKAFRQSTDLLLDQVARNTETSLGPRSVVACCGFCRRVGYRPMQPLNVSR